jgi:UDP-N-acetylmuramyl pentapeptide phosphotransferase/UDP-N-acetylglucosamine-1-phosphate transferase
VGVSSHELIITALVTWTVTALLGVNLLFRGRAYLLWRRLRQRRRLPSSRPPYRARRTPRARAVLVLLHITFAACGLGLWLLYVVFDLDELVYISAGLLVVVSIIGFGVVDRWRHVPGRHAPSGFTGPMFPIWSATAHVMAGTATFVLVLLTLLAGHND